VPLYRIESCRKRFVVWNDTVQHGGLEGSEGIVVVSIVGNTLAGKDLVQVEQRWGAAFCFGWPWMWFNAFFSKVPYPCVILEQRLLGDCPRDHGEGVGKVLPLS
jgi:hypothetical protein